MKHTNKIEFIHHETSNIRRHYVTQEDVKIMLSRLPSELWSRLKKIHFKDDARGNRTLGYTTTRGRREVTLCALPHRLSLNRAFKPRPMAKDFGALDSSQWPSLAIRRFMLYDVLLHEIGHLQIILPKNTDPRRKFADETLAQSFAGSWRKQLWSKPYEHPDPVHNPPNKKELQTLYLVDKGLLKKPTLYLSDFFERHKAEYYDALTRVRITNDIEHWLKIFLVGVSQTAADSKQTFEKIIKVRHECEQKIMTLGKRAKIGQQLLLELFSQPIMNTNQIAERINSTHQTASSLAKNFSDLGILQEDTGFKRNRRFVFSDYLNLFVDRTKS